LYNHAYWWEAHEEWEGIWKSFDKGTVPRQFLQGLIQVSACHLKLFLGHRDGVARLRWTSAEHLSAAIVDLPETEFMGLDVAVFLDLTQAYFNECAADCVHDPQNFPYIWLAD
jgi:hypothetical protein